METSFLQSNVKKLPINWLQTQSMWVKTCKAGWCSTPTLLRSFAHHLGSGKWSFIAHECSSRSAQPSIFLFTSRRQPHIRSGGWGSPIFPIFNMLPIGFNPLGYVRHGLFSPFLSQLRYCPKTKLSCNLSLEPNKGPPKHWIVSQRPISHPPQV